MTIALGVLSRDGVVLAADTEETHGAFKSLQSKIYTGVYLNNKEPVYSRTAIGISGAGTAAHIDLLAEEWLEVFLNNSILIDRQPRQALAKHLREFYATYLLPFVGVTDDQRPEIYMIAALSGGPKKQLLVSERSVLRPAGGTVAVGYGEGVATMLLNRLWHPGLDLRAAILLASYVVWFVKETVPYCGKSTEILVLTDGEGSYVPWQDVHDLEAIFQRTADLEAHLVRYVIGGTTRGDDILSTAEELKAACATKLHKLLPVQTHSLLTAKGTEGVMANNWKIDFVRKSGRGGDVPRLPITVKRVRPASKRGRKARPPSRE